MQNSSNELSTEICDSKRCEQKKVKFLTVLWVCRWLWGYSIRLT